MKHSITNLHKQITDNKLVKNIQTTLGHITDQISEHLPDLSSRLDISGHHKLKKIKSNFLKKLEGKRKKFRLALESLGWGTLADLLDQAFCGEKLNIWV